MPASTSAPALSWGIPEYLGHTHALLGQGVSQITRTRKIVTNATQKHAYAPGSASLALRATVLAIAASSTRPGPALDASTNCANAVGARRI